MSQQLKTLIKEMKEANVMLDAARKILGTARLVKDKEWEKKAEKSVAEYTGKISELQQAMKKAMKGVKLS